MKIRPRYDAEPAVRFDGSPAAVATPFLRQRRRLVDIARSLTPEELAAPSRCEGWRVQDVLAHLAGTDPYWVMSMRAGLAGEPTRILERFDPKRTPAGMVDAVRDAAPEEIVATFADAVTEFCALAASLSESDWAATGEAPSGHVALSALAYHALWDAWIHERDILLPLGKAQPLEDDEVIASLRHVAALGPAFALQSDPTLTGTLVLDVTNPSARVVVSVNGGVVVVASAGSTDGAAYVAGDAVELVEALSVRRAWTHALPPDKAWMARQLEAVFA